MDIDYLAIGNPTIDQLPDGTGIVGGTVVYGAVQAAQLGLHACVRGRADRAEIQPYLPQDARITWELQDAPQTTKFTNDTQDGVRHQLLHSTAGPIDLGTDPLRARVVHAGPVDAEVDLDAVCALADPDAFVGVTPQGLFRYWGADQIVHLQAIPFRENVIQRVNAVVVGPHEGSFADALMRGVSDAGGIAVRTLGSRGCEVWSGSFHEVFPPAAHVEEIDDTGAGDVFAATLFLSLADAAPLPDAVAFAQAAAAASVRGVSVSGIAAFDEIEALLASV